MSIKVSGIMINPAGESVANAQITLRAVTNSLTVLTGFSVTVKTSSSGAYSVQLEPGSYSLTVATEGHSFVYGAITLDETTGPSTLNQLLKQQLMESDLTPDLILYFRQIQQQVSNDLTTIKTLEKSASDSATNASNSRNEAKQYATDLSTALATAKGYRDQSGVSANTAKGFRDEAEIFANRAKSSAESIDTPALEQKINSKLPLAGGTLTGPLISKQSGAITFTPMDATAYNWIHWTQVDGTPGFRMGRLENNGSFYLRDYSDGGVTALTLAKGQWIWTTGNQPPSDHVPWINLTLQNGWVTSGAANAYRAAFRKFWGLVFVEVSITGGTIGNGIVLFTLPAGYRPAYSTTVPVVCVSGTEYSGLVTIRPSGEAVIGGILTNQVIALSFNFSPA